MSHYTRSKGLGSLILAVAVVLTIMTLFSLMAKVGYLNFTDTTIKVTRNMETNTKVFALLYSTKDGVALDKLIAESVVADSEDESLINFIINEIEKMEKETTSSYYFYVVFDGKKYFESQKTFGLSGAGARGDTVQRPFAVPSTVLIAVPYNSRALTAEVNFVEW